jgi:hypothetical protein
VDPSGGAPDIGSGQADFSLCNNNQRANERGGFKRRLSDGISEI